MFKARQGRLEEQIEQLMQMKRAMESIITATDEGLAGPFGIPELVDMGEEYLIATRLRQENVTLDNFVNSLYDHYVYCEPIPEVIKHPTGSIYTKENFLSGSNQDSFLYSRCTARINSDRLFVKPAGRYVRIFLRGKDMNGGDIFKILRDYIAENNLTVCGYVYELDLITYFTENMDDFVFKFMVQVI
jgi:effector-binding domain-containing protein